MAAHPRPAASTPPDAPPTGGSFGTIVRDRVLLLFFLSGTFATLVYVAYETLLPISLADSHGLAPSTWGFLVVVNPLTVTLFQLRITARTAHVRVRDRRDALDPDLADRGGAHRARRHARRLHRRDTAMWLLFTGLAVAGAIIGFAACTRAFGLTRAAEGELDEMAVAAG